jgi:hypothetical protein
LANSHYPQETAAKLSELQETLAILRLRLVLRTFDPNQPRWPGGRSDGGQWRLADALLNSLPSSAGEGDDLLVAGRLDQRREAMCAAQYELDRELCLMSKSRLCWETAMQRRAACIANDYVPELRH